MSSEGQRIVSNTGPLISLEKLSQGYDFIRLVRQMRVLRTIAIDITRQIMAAQPGRVRVYQHDQAVAFQVEGQATMHHSPAVRRYAEQNLTVGTTALSVDLRRCSHMDSTFLGTLLFLKRLVERCDEGTFALISPSPQCRQLLREMGLEKIFAVVDREELAPDVWTELESGPGDLPAFKRNVMQAHQELSRLEGPAGETFRALATEMAEELNSGNPEGEQKQK